MYMGGEDGFVMALCVLVCTPVLTQNIDHLQSKPVSVCWVPCLNIPYVHNLIFIHVECEGEQSQNPADRILSSANAVNVIQELSGNNRYFLNLI